MQLLFRWAYARDAEDWEALSASFHDDAIINIGWITGSAKDYVEKAREQARSRSFGIHAKHIVSAPIIEVIGGRATSLCHATLHVRRDIGGVEADIESFMRFFDLLECREGRWAIVKRTGIYEKDRLTAVDPKGVPPGFWDGIDLGQFPPAKRFLCFAQVTNGSKPNVNFISVNSPEEKMLYADGRRWLSGI
jgi:SnoaL-like domain